jgi:hypothetical protein
VFDFPKLQVALKDKRVFVIRVSHESFRYEASLRPSNYEISVWSLRPDRALMIGGDRCRVAASFVSRLPWRSEAAESVLDDLRQISLTEQTQMKESVTRFETSLLQGFQAFFAADAVRIYDRAVLYHPEFDGSAVIEELSKVLHIEIKGPGEESKLETTSPCRWGSLRLADWMSKQGRTEDQIRGLILLSWDLLTPSLHGTLAGIAQELRKKQTGH